MEKNTFRILLLLALISICAKSETVGFFTGFPMSKNLTDRANTVLNNLRAALNNLLTCDDKPGFPTTDKVKLFESLRDQPGYRYRHSIYALAASFLGQNQVQERENRINNMMHNTFHVLNEVRRQFQAWNNVIAGGNNVVIGDKNFVIGNSNVLVGNNNWLFTSDARSTRIQQGVLLVDRFLIEIEVFMRNNKIRQVIHCLSTKDRNDMSNRFWNQTSSRSRVIV